MTAMSAVLPTSDFPSPAPGEETYVSLRLANSWVDMPNGRTFEALGSSAEATTWLIEQGLAQPETELQDYCANRLISMRHHVRNIFATVSSGQPPEASSVTAINEALTRTPSARLLGWEPNTGFSSQPLHPTTQIVEHALAAIASDLVTLVTGANAELLATCDATPCNRYMLRTHARRHWCSKRCGDRVRAARSYARRKAQSVT